MPKIGTKKMFVRFWEYNIYKDRFNTILNSFKIIQSFYLSNLNFKSVSSYFAVSSHNIVSEKEILKNFT